MANKIDDSYEFMANAGPYIITNDVFNHFCDTDRLISLGTDEDISNLEFNTLLMRFFDAENNKCIYGKLKGADIYRYLNTLHPDKIAGTETLHQMFKFYFDKSYKSYKNKNNVANLLHCHTNVNIMLQELNMKKKSDYHQIIENIGQKGYQISQEDLTNIIVPFAIRRREQMKYQELLSHIDSCKITAISEEKKRIRREEAELPELFADSSFLTLRSGFKVYHL